MSPFVTFAVFASLPLAQDTPPSAPSAAVEFAQYEQELPAVAVKFRMVPIPGGRFTLGSPEGEADRGEDEGPQVEVEIEPFWMGACEVTWAEYDAWNTDTSRPMSKQPDGLSRPTPPYMDMTFDMGRDGFPAICMSHTAAREYCRWLSEKTGHFHRLPTEAEWEYACRAGATTPWHCGADPAELDRVAWHAGNSGRVLEPGAPPRLAYQRVGTKEPNAFGLFDMHGNVAEWVADRYVADAYDPVHGEGLRRTPYFPPTRDASGRPMRFPHVVRGGSHLDAPAGLRSAARRASDPLWNQRDPQLPKSYWYLTEGQHVGFRVVRPLREPDAEQRARFENP